MRRLFISLLVGSLLIPTIVSASPSSSAADSQATPSANADSPVLYDTAPLRPRGILVDELDTEAPTPGSRPLSFFVLSNMRGQLAQISCEDDATVGDDSLRYARQAAHYHQLSERADDPRRRPVALNAGDSSLPGALPRYLLSDQDRSQTYAELLNQIPYAGFGLGDGDMGMEREQLLNLADGSQKTGLPLQAANVQCDPDSDVLGLCDALGTAPGKKPWKVVDQEGLSIGVVSLLDPAAVNEIAKSRAEDIEFERPSTILPRVVQAMREQDGVDMVVVQLHLVEDRDRSELIDMASAVSGIDLLFTNRALGDGYGEEDGMAPNGYVVAPRTGTYIIGTDTRRGRTSTIDLRLERDDDHERWRIESLDTRLWNTEKLDPHPRTADMIEEIGQDFCRDWGGPINPNLPLARPFNQRDLAQFILNTMRFETDSEIALVNRETFASNEFFPIEDDLTLADIYAFLPFNNRLVTLDLKGDVLKSLAAQLGSRLEAVGLSKEGDDIEVNGRALDTDRTYRVATHRFLATGGDDILSESQIENKRVYRPPWAEKAPAIGDIIARFVRLGALDDAAQINDRLHPEKSFADLHRKFLWLYSGSINSAFNRVNVNNPTVDGSRAYDQSQLNVNETTQINLEGTGEIRADSRDHVWDNKLSVQYAQARVGADSEQETFFEETRDLIRHRSTYQYAGFRADLDDRWYVPMPFSELQAETEFSSPEERDWHKFELTGIAGAKLELFDPLEVRLGANVRRDINEPDGQATFGLNAGYLLKRNKLVDLFDKPVQFESELEYFYNDIGNDNIQELRNTNRAYFALLDQLFFTATFQAFAYGTDEVGELGSNTELTVGLNYLWDWTHQAF
ncbi:MAG: 5'-nucleotidase C-terminal domain-containing protein [Persicimonas sp.]